MDDATKAAIDLAVLSSMADLDRASARKGGEPASRAQVMRAMQNAVDAAVSLALASRPRKVSMPSEAPVGLFEDDEDTPVRSGGLML